MDTCVLEDQIDVFLVLEIVVELANVYMLKSPLNLDLPLQVIHGAVFKDLPFIHLD